MYNLTIENEYGNSLTFNQVGGAYTITEIEGLSPAEADIQTSTQALIDGEKFNSAKIQMRTLNIAFAIEYSAEHFRMEAYKVLHAKKKVKVSYKSDMRDVYIEGYVKSMPITHFEPKQVVTVSILCPDPYWKGAETIINELASVASAFHFPFASTATPELVFGTIEVGESISIDNDGAAECGLTIECQAIDTITNPKIINYMTNDYFQVNYTLQAGDLLRITTYPGNKAVRLLRDGEWLNLFNYVKNGSTWLQLDIGSNEFVYTVGTGQATDLFVTFKHQTLYEGV